jgi:hypothetical protein
MDKRESSLVAVTSEQLPTKENPMSAKTVQRARASIELIIFGFMVSLTLKAGLDTAYSKTLTTAITWNDLYQHLLILPSLQLFIFLLTLVRFVYGAYRTLEVIEESSEELERWVLIWNIPGMLVLFVLFYITSLSVQQPEPFYTGMILVHVWDLLWFIIPALFSDQLEQDMKHVMRKFLVIDILTVILLLLLLKFSGVYFAFTGAAVMVLLAALDFSLNRRFFFYRDKWRTTPRR